MINRDKFDEWSYKSEEVLEYLYEGQSWEQSDIADEFGVTEGTISRWMSKFGIETDYETINKLGVDEVRRLYWEEGKTQREIAELVGSRQENISRYMEKHGIEARDASHTTATFYLDDNGYEYWYSKADGCRYPIHRLIAVSELGKGELDGKEVHHKNGIPWDNRPENLELLTPSEHAKRHRNSEGGG